MQADRDQRRKTFDEVAVRYDEIRPGYPAALLRELADLVPITAGTRILEIGCGTGQATLALAELGCQIVAVEFGPRMAAIARRKLADFPSVTVDIAPFEDWPLPDEGFDLVLSATAFHWLDPAVRVTKIAQALRPNGALAIIATHQIAGGDEQFFTIHSGVIDVGFPPLRSTLNYLLLRRFRYSMGRSPRRRSLRP